MFSLSAENNFLHLWCHNWNGPQQFALGSLATADVNYELARHNADSPWVEVQYMFYCEDCKGLFSIQSSLKGILTHAGLLIILFPFFVRHSFLLWWCPVFCDLMIFVMWEWQKQIHVFIQLSFCLSLPKWKIKTLLNLEGRQQNTC